MQKTMEPLGGYGRTARDLPVDTACAADHLELLRIVAVDGFHPGPDPLDLVPDAVVGEVTLVALIGELDLELADLRLERIDCCDIGRERCGGQRTEHERRADLRPANEDRLRLSQHILGVKLIRHGMLISFLEQCSWILPRLSPVRQCAGKYETGTSSCQYNFSHQFSQIRKIYQN
jgi:hypothetical protein